MTEALALTLELEGTQLIEASAGTGKTWTLSVLLVRALIERDLRCANVLAITFTRAATAEIRSRVLELLRALDLALCDASSPQEDAAVAGLLTRITTMNLSPALAAARTRRALAEFDDLSVFTIHGFYQRTLSENALSSGELLDAGVETNLQPELESIARELWRRELAHHHTLSAVCDESTARTIAALLLEYKREGEKLAVMQTPEAMAAWVKRLLQRAPQAMSEAPEVCAEGFANELRTSLPLMQDCERAITALREVFSATEVANALIALRERKQFSSSAYARHHVANWLTEIGQWLDAGSLLDEVPQRLSTHFTSDAIRGVLKEPDAELPTSLQNFVSRVDVWLVASRAWQARLQAVHAQLCAWVFASCAAQLPVRLAARGVRSADNLAPSLVTALQGPRGQTLAQSLRARYALVLVDEFQDTDSAQWAVLQRVFVQSNTPLLLVGDPKQAIYRFRGADIAAYLRARAQARAVHALSDNFRSTPKLIAVLNALFSGEGAGGSFGDPSIHYTPIHATRDEVAEGTAFTVQHFAHQGTVEALRTEAVSMAVRSVQSLLAQTRPEQIAVLVERNEDVLAVSQALAQAGIAAAAQRRQPIAKSFEALQVQWFIEALARPLDESHLKRLMLTPLWGNASAELDDAVVIAANQSLMIEWSALARARGPAAALERLIRERLLVPRMLSGHGAEAEEALARLRQVAELVQLYAANVDLDEGLRFLRAWRDGSDEPRAYAPHTTLANSGLNATDALPSDHRLAAPRLASERAAVQVMTVHASKGLEYEAVVLPLLWAGKEASEPCELLMQEGDGGDGAQRWHFGPAFDAAALARHASDEAGERQRVAYVALTRARDRCVLLWPEAADVAAEKVAQSEKSEKSEKSDKATQRAEMSALGALLGAREWSRMGVQIDTYSHLSNQAANINQGNLNDTNNSIYEKPVDSETGRHVWPLVPRAWQTMSFSRWERGLAVAATAQDSVESEEVLIVADRDDDVRVHDEGLESPVAITELRYAFPRGPAAGRALHAMLERLPFHHMTADATAINLVTQSLMQHGMPPNISAEATMSWLQAVAQARLSIHADAPAFKLSDVAAHLQQREWEFHLPLAGTSAASLQGALQAMGVSSVASIEAAASLPPGFFTGFVDLVFEYEGRYYIADYKSNYLGDRDEDYAQTALAKAVAEHHYDAQAALYLLALHRHLLALLPHYSPQQHLGGVCLLFLRGMFVDQAKGVWVLPWTPDGLNDLNHVIN